MKKGPHLLLYDESDEERICSIDFGMIRPGTPGWEIPVLLWNKKGFSDAPSATDVRICAVAGNSCSTGIIENKYLSVKSDGIIDPDNRGIVDDSETEFTKVGGSLVDEGGCHSIGDIPSNCARRLIFRLDLPEDFSVNGFPRLIIQAGCFSEKVKWLYVPDA
ncbi:MAG TPA: hypothetical protein ENN67_02580 [Firmicutes bacterium]|nr:hypothetical protein [Bacillota bacterium]